MVDIPAAIEFVSSHGDRVERTRLEYILSDKPAPDEVVEGLFAGQRKDGGWSSFWAENYSSLDATCFRLAQAEQLGVQLSHPRIVRALDFLSNRQDRTGSWEEEEQVTGNAPPWAMPGDLAARIYLTANCGFWTAVLSDHTARAKSAGDFLLAHSRDGRLPSFLHAHWLALGLWSRSGFRKPAEEAGKFLLDKLVEMDSGQLAWMVNALRIGEILADDILVVQAVSRLEASQDKDGRWKSGDGPERDVHTTLEALRGLEYSGYDISGNSFDFE